MWLSLQTWKKRRFGALALALSAWARPAALVALSNCSSGRLAGRAGTTTTTVITNVAIVSTRDGTVQQNMSVVLQGAKIQQIAPSASVQPDSDAQVVDGTGKYLVPGFSDMHTHVMQAADSTPSFWPQMIANGVTSFREMAGSAAEVARAKKLNADSASGEVLAPELLMTPSTILTSADPAMATQLVQQEKSEGADFIKIVVETPDTFNAVMAEAKAQGLPVAGHISPSIGARAASDAGVRSIEHLGPDLGILVDCSTDEAAVRAAIIATPTPALTSAQVQAMAASPFLNRAPQAPLFQHVIDTYDDGKCRALAQTFVKNQTWHTVTLFRIATLTLSDDPSFQNDPDQQYIAKSTLALWHQLADQFAANTSASAHATFAGLFKLQTHVLQVFRDQGVRMLAGSDDTGIWCVPGFGLHQEFRRLSGVGFTPLQVLQMTTLNAAEFSNRMDSMGAVEVGKNADLVLLDADPMASADNLDRIDAVFVKGRYQSRSDLDAMLAASAAAYANGDVGTARDAKAAHE